MTKLEWSAILLLSAAALLLLEEFPGIRRRILFRFGYILIATLSIINYMSDLGSPPHRVSREIVAYIGERVDPYDLTFYYLNTKYFPEIGYYDLYPLLLKTAYDGRFAPFKFRSDKLQLQSDEGYFWRSYEEVMKDEVGYATIRSRFSDDRWLEFLSDTRYLLDRQRGWNPKRWTNFFWDHGFNASPVWLTLMRPLTAIVPVTWVKFLCLADLFLLCAALTVAGMLIGSRPVLLAVTLLATSFSTEWPPIGLVMGRYDFVACLILAVALLARGRVALAGICWGLAICARYIPVAALPFVIAIWLARRGREEGKQAAVLLTWTVSVSLLLHCWAVAALPAGSISRFFEKMIGHTSVEHLTRGKVGLALAVSWNGDMQQRQIDEPRKQRITVLKPFIYSVALFLMIGLLLAIVRLPLAAALSWLPFAMFLWMMPSYHYFVLFILPLLADRELNERAGGIMVKIGGGVLVIEAIVRILRIGLPRAPVSVTSLWCVLIALLVIWTVVLGSRERPNVPTI